MKFDPKSEKEISEANMFVAGEYDFEVVEAAETTSKAGNEMVQLSVKVYDSDGGSRLIDDFLVATDKAAFKLRQFAEAVDLLGDYERGEIRADAMIGRAGRCKVIIKKDTTGQYPDKNAIGAYLKPKAAKLPASSATTPHREVREELDDSIPF